MTNGFRSIGCLASGLLLTALAAPPLFGAQQEPDSVPDAWIPTDLSSTLRVKAAFNGAEILWRFEWPAASAHFVHDVLVYEGGTWVARGDAGGGPDPDGLREDRISFMIDAGEVPGFANQGCYVTCHAGLPSMADELGADTVRQALGEAWAHSDLAKYLASSRIGDRWWEAPWDRVRPPSELEALARSGVFLDLWHWRAGRSNPVGFSDDQYVLEYRNNDGPSGPYSTNWDAAESRPLMMFDSVVVGVHALRWDRLMAGEVTQDGPHFLASDRMVPFDPDRPWEDGDVIPRRILRVPEGDRGDIRAEGRWESGTWTVQLRRAMDTGQATTDHSFLEGRTYHVAFAIHSEATSGRWHRISLPVHLGIGTPAELTAFRFEGDTPDWDEAEWLSLPIYYPAQVTWEWLTSDAHPGAPGVRADDRSCQSCHGADAPSALKLAQASVYQERRLQGPGVEGGLALFSVVLLLLGGTVASLRTANRGRD